MKKIILLAALLATIGVANAEPLTRAEMQQVDALGSQVSTLSYEAMIARSEGNTDLYKKKINGAQAALKEGCSIMRKNPELYVKAHCLEIAKEKTI